MYAIRSYYVTPAELPETFGLAGAADAAPLPQAPGLGKPLPEILEEVEADLIRRAMIQAKGVQAQAARLLGISRSNLQYQLGKLDLSGD